MLDTLSRIRIVLARPKDAENVGSVCRAMKTMGIIDLSIVGESSFDLERASVVAVHAADVLAASIRFPTVEAAVAGRTFVAGATRRWGKRRKLSRITPAELAERIVSKRGSYAIVFGNEATGLNDEELDACHVTVTIPSSRQSRSLNLSHAVQIVCYEIYHRLHTASGKRFYTPVDAERLGRAVAEIKASLEAAGVADDGYSRLLRGLLSRAAVSGGELKRFQALFAKLSGLSRKRNA